MEINIKNVQDLKAFYSLKDIKPPLILKLTNNFFTEDNLKNFPFQWHLKDSKRSFLTTDLNNPKFEFSYRRIFSPYISMIGSLITKQYFRSSVINIWDKNYIGVSYITRIPCLLLLSFHKDHICAIWRKRDINKRLIPNLYCLFKIIPEFYKNGNSIYIIDISLDIINIESDKNILKKWITTL